MVCFWAWNLIGPVAMTDAAYMSLSSTEESLLVATPIIVGSLGRLAVGPLTDRFGGRVMFVAVSLAAIPPVLTVGFAESRAEFPPLLVAAVFLGVAGTVFAVGIPFANNWYEPSRRGLAAGVFGMGMAGTAVSAFFTPRFARWFGLFHTHLIVAAALAATAALCLASMRNGPYFVPNADRVLPKLKAAARLRASWEMSLLYLVVFGGFVAFSNFLPTYLKTVYGFSAVAAGTRTAIFALAAVLARPVGGALADRIAAKYVVLAALSGVVTAVVVAIFKPPAGLWGATTFISLAISLGVGTGAVFGWVTRRAPRGCLGAVTGIVSAAGGLGGYFPPLVMGATYDPVHNDYTVGLVTVTVVALIALGYTALWLPGRDRVA